MKQMMKTFFPFLLILITVITQAQSLAIISADVRNIEEVKAQVLVDMIRLELEEHSNIPVMDRYEVQDKLQELNLKNDNCLSTSCLSGAAKQLGVTKMVTATVEKLGEKIYYTVRLVDSEKGINERSIVEAFIPQTELLQQFTSIMIRRLFNIEVLEEEKRPYVKADDFASKLNLPESDYIRANGPRMGVSIHFGSPSQEIFQKPKSEGGYDIAFPVFYQFGYQFEKQYLTAGSFQALVECLVLVSGVEQGIFAPTLTIMNGFRSSSNGLEFAFGPTFGLTRKAEGYENQEGQFIITNDVPEGFDVKNQMDSRGESQLNAGFVFGIGKTFRTGNMNIPVNGYFTTNKEAFSYGLSIGFNSASFR